MAGYFPSTREEAERASRYPLTWVRCDQCGLVQVREDIADDALYDQYRYGSSTVPGLARHFEEYATFLSSRLGPGNKTVVEIGCNDGVLLTQLPANWRRIGVDPSDIASAAVDRTYRLISAPFDLRVADSLPERGAVNLVTSSNAMAHFTGLLEALRAAHDILAPGGEFFIEVHDLDSTITTGQWDTVYHEHKVEWSERSLAACLARVGFEPSYLERLPLHGGLLRAGFRRLDRPVWTGVPARESFELLGAAYRGRRNSNVARRLLELEGGAGSIAAYGAAGRANVWLNQMTHLRFDWIVDGSPHRSGRWIPTVAVPVVPPEAFDENPPAACLITAWNHAGDIRAKHPGFQGEWLQTFEEGAVAS